MSRLSGDRSLIVAPLAVCYQTVEEAAKIGLEVRYVRSDEDAAGPGIWITNYEMHDRFDPRWFDAVTLDESSILKNSLGRTRTKLIKQFACIPRRLSATATPAPNDPQELTSQAEFLGVMTRPEMLAAYFVHDDEGWRLKGHAREPMFRWMAQWACALRSPADLGYPDDGYRLPPLHLRTHLVRTSASADDLKGIVGRSAVRAATVEDRCAYAVSLAQHEPHERWLLWAGRNDEARLLAAALPGAVNVEGSWRPEAKAEALLAFARSEIPVLVTKPSIAGFGMNWQSCARMAFVGLSDCYDEQTEVLTRDGWKTFGKVSLDDDLATVHPETQAFEWQAPSRVVWEPYSGPMLHFRGQRNFDLLVTPNHKLYVQRCPLRFPGGDSSWQLRYAADIADRFRRSEYRMLSAPVSADGERLQWVEIPAYGRINSRSRAVARLGAEDFMRLAGWYLSEGYCRPLGSQEAGRIVLCQTDKNPQHRAEIVDLMRRIGLNVNDRTKDITGYSINLAAYLLEQFGDGAYEKRIPRWIKDLHPDLLVVLRDTMIKGDGGHSGGVPRYYRTASAQLADDFQEISLRTGIRAAVHYRESCGTGRYSDVGIYDVSLAWERIRPSIHTPPDLVQYTGMIGCATVPNHLLIVRRNGIPVISGNSFEQYFQCIRRCWRYGQLRSTYAHIVLSEAEAAVAENVYRKEEDAEWMISELIATMNAERRAVSEVTAA